MGQRDFDDVNQPRSASNQLVAQQAPPACIGEMQLVVHAIDLDDAVAIGIGYPAGAQGS